MSGPRSSSNNPSGLPTPSYSQALSFTSPSTTSNNYVPVGSGPPVTAADLTTQVGRTSGHNSNAQSAVSAVDGYNLNKRSTYCNSHNISKLIIVVAGLFFLVLSYKYTTLRPTIDIEKLVCETGVEELSSDDIVSENVLQTCVPKELEDAVTNITRDLVNLLEARGVEYMCSEKSEIKNNTMSVSEILQRLTWIKAEDEVNESREEGAKYSSEYDIRSNGFEDDKTDVLQRGKVEEDYDDVDISVESKDTTKYMETSAYKNVLNKSLRSNMQLVLTLIHENPQWGIKISPDPSQESLQTVTTERSINMDDEYEEKIDGENKPDKFAFDTTYLSVVQPPINWECWISLWLVYLYSLLFTLLVYLACLAVVLVIVYGAYRFYCWRQEKLIREQQDVFELVEQVLSMLVTQHQQFHAMTVAANANASQTGGVGNVPSRPCLAVNHIRDQLIPPTVSISSIKPYSFWFANSMPQLGNYQLFFLSLFLCTCILQFWQVVQGICISSRCQET